MNDQRKTGFKWKIRLAVILIGVAGVAVAAVAAVDQIVLRTRLADCRDENPEVRLEALRQLADQRDARAAKAVGELLADEKSRPVLERAGYTAMRIRERSNLPLLQRCAEQGPDDSTRARLLLYAGRLADRDVRLLDWFRDGLDASAKPWRRTGSAIGLLEIGQPEGGPVLMEIASQADHPARNMAYTELRRIGIMMTEAVGWPIDWPTSVDKTDTSFWENLERFWQAHGTSRLLNDVLSRRYGQDPDLYELRRLLHARDKVAKWFE